MGLLFRKRFRLSKWLSLNLSKSGLGLSVGPPGAKLSVNQKRARVQLGLPGTGIGYRKDMSLPQDPTAPQARRSWAWVWLLLIVGLLVMWRLLSGCVAVPPGTAQSSQTIELYDASGKHTSYGKVQSGSIELFNPDSSRSGFGKGRAVG